ncbi:MAG TPA: hypothetical protein VNQ90_01290 [Chthoniobacteraceae bacterium]|nr:hypothetical protein [Chthoniobacteraceae bacterium]
MSILIKILAFPLVAALSAIGNAAPPRYQSDRVMLENAADHGLSGSDLTPAEPLSFPRARPLPLYAREGKHPEKSGSVERRTVEARLSGSDNAPVTTGFPLPQGALFSPRHLRVLDAGGAELPAQVSATTFWPDGSIRWALLEFAAPGKAFAVEFGNAVERSGTVSPLRLERKGAQWTLHTGAIDATVDTQRFQLLSRVRSADDGRDLGGFAPGGARLEGADGTLYTSAARPPDSVSVEREGPQTIVLRAEGAYADGDGKPFMRYVTRLVFRAGSPRVEIIYRHLNTELEHELTDIRSLELPFELPKGETGGRLLLSKGGESAEAARLSLFQQDENHALWSAGSAGGKAGRTPGVLGVRSGEQRLAVACTDFWQRWPKGLALENGEVKIALLPQQPAADYGSKLPAHLIYPFVNGLYRLKWGMSFTERVMLDFAPPASLQTVAAAVNDAPLAILPSAWYAETGAIGLMAPENGAEFAEWDAYFERGAQALLQRREENREYGFLNYGDWFGERGRNWGNNEYDIAHAYFMQFARTGQPHYYRIALAAARHQADVDIVHAYPDPAFIGANPQHSIGHTGQWSQVPQYATWSHRYDGHTDATNGHTWAEGMVEAWWLAGEPAVMESALLLGEHITWAVAPGFQISPAYPRSAGWSLRAIVALYEGTGDPEYLKAAGSIARSAIAAQDASGIWVRSFKSKGSEDRGISNFQLGLTLAGLGRYAEVSGDAAAREAVSRGMHLLAKAWPGSGGWPYDILINGQPAGGRARQSLTTNILNAETVAIGAWRENDPHLRRVAEEVVRNTLFYTEPVAHRQTNGLLLRSGQAVLGALHRAYREQGAHWPGLAVEKDPEVYFHGVLDARKFEVRGPGAITFRLKTNGEAGQLRLRRVSRNAFVKGQGEAQLHLSKPDGRALWERKLSLKGAKQEIAVELPEGKGEILDLRIEEPADGVWDLDTEALAGVLLKVDEGVRLSGISLSKYALVLPQAMEKMNFTFTGTHPGASGIAVLEGERVLGWQRVAQGGGTLEVASRPQAPGKPLTLVLWAGGDLRINLSGGEAWLARNPSEAFAPVP